MRRTAALPALLALAAATAVSGAARAEEPDTFGPLDLTDDQRVAVEQAFAAHRETVEGRRDALRDARRSLGAAMESDTFDEGAIRAASAAVAAIEADLAVERARLRGELRTILTAEQFDRWTDRRERRGPGRHRPHRPRR